jgi:hypothetical protein
VDRKKYWDLLETLRWIGQRDERLVAAMSDLNDDDRMALGLSKSVLGVVRSPPGPSGSDRGADIELVALSGEVRAPPTADEVLSKVRSGRVRMTAIRCDRSTDEQIPVPLVELNELEVRFIPGHRVAPVGLWSRLRGTLVWRSPQFLQEDVVNAWPGQNTKTVAVSAAVLRHLRRIMNPEAPLTKPEARRRCLSEVSNAYPGAFEKAWRELDLYCKRGRGKHGRRAR